QPRQVVVRGDQVRAFFLERVQIQRQRRDQGLAFACLHLSNAAREQYGAGQHLHVVVALANRAARGFANGRERLRQQVIEALAGQEAATELGGLVAQGVVGERLVIPFQSVDLGKEGLKFLYFAFGGVTAELR